MSLYNNFKSILFKQKYYCISYKLNYILKSNLFTPTTGLVTFHNPRLMRTIFINCNEIQSYHKFILNKLILIHTKNGRRKSELHKLDDRVYRDDGPALIFYHKNGTIKSKYYFEKKHCNLSYETIIFVQQYE